MIFYTVRPTSGISHGFRWNQQTGFESLGSLPGGSDTTHPYALSYDGSIVTGYSSGSLPGGSNNIRPFHWTQLNGMVNIDVPETGTGEGAGWNISSDGSTIVGFCYVYGSTVPPPRKAFYWTEEEGSILLGDMIGGIGFSQAKTVSANGAVIVGQTNTSAYGVDYRWYEAFIWSQETGMELLFPDQSIPGGATDISLDGSVVLGGGIFNGSTRSYIWTREEGATFLGPLPDGKMPSSAMDLSGDGQIAAGGGYGGPDPWIWDEVNGSRYLEDILIDDYDFDLAGWSLSNITGISDNGTVIVGNGINPLGQEEGWIVTIPEPCTLLLLGLGSLALRLKRSR